MNKIFKVIYSKTRHCYVVVSELAKSHCKTTQSHTVRSKTALTAAVLLALGTFSVASVFMPMTAEAATTKTDGSNFVGVERTDGLLDDNKYDNYGGKGANGADSITIGLKAQAGAGTITIGDRNAGASLGSVYVGQGDIAKPKLDTGGWATSIGYNSDATGYGSIALGSNAVAKNSYAQDSKGESLVYQQTVVENGEQKVRLVTKPDIQRASVAIGYGASADNGNIAIGSYSDASTDLRTAKDDVAKAYLTESKADSYVSVGKSDALRRISNVADGASVSDVATVGQLQALSKELGGYKSGFGIQIDPDSTDKTKNTISLNRNLGKDYSTTDDVNLKNDAAGTSLILGGRVEKSSLTGGQSVTGDYGALGKDSVTVGGVDNTVETSGDAAVVVGGIYNKAAGTTSAVVGGSANDAIGNESAIFGGNDNDAYDTYATISGGSWNKAYGNASSIFGGSVNDVSGRSSVAVGGYGSHVYGDVSVGIAGGSTNADYALAAGNEATVTVNNGTAIGYQATANKEGTVAFGHDKGDVYYTSTWPQKATEKDGKYYDAKNKEITKDQYEALRNADLTFNDYSQKPKVTENKYDAAAYNRLVKVDDGVDDHDVVVMEQLKNAKNDLKVNAGWGINVNDVTTKNDGTETTTKNVISLNRNLGTNYGNPWKGEGKVTFEAGGENSMILGGAASILFNNEEDNVKAGAYGKDSVLVGGFNNLIDTVANDVTQTGENAVIVGGDTNKVTGLKSVIVGGYKNTVSGGHSIVIGGASNETDGGGAGVFGGQLNKAAGGYSSVLGGDHNEADGDWSSAIGGTTNTASGLYATTLGGKNNDAKGKESVVVGGGQNVAIGEDSTVNGGAQNTSYGMSSYVAGGMNNMAFGNASVALGGIKSNVNAKVSTGIAGGSTEEKAITALAAGHQSVVTNSGVEWRKVTQEDVDAINQKLPSWSGFIYTEPEEPYTTYVLDKVSTAVGYQSTADAPGVIAFGHDKGDVASVAKKWKQKATMEVGDDYSVKFYDANHKEISAEDYYKLANADGTLNDYTQDPIGTENTTYQSAYYNRLVKAADGIDAHDAVVMEQLKPYTKSDASNIGSNLKTYTVGDDGETITEAGASDEDKIKNENAWGKAIGTGKIEADNGQLVTGKTVYDEVRPTQDGNYVKKTQTTGENLSALDSKIGKLDETKTYNYIDSKASTTISDNLTKLDTQVKDNADAITNINHSISTLDQNAVKYDDSNKSKITLGGEGGTTITNVKSALDGAKDANGNIATIATATGDALKNAANLGDLQKVYNDISAKADKASTSHTALTVEGNTSAGKGKDEKTKEDIYAGKNILLHESTDENGKVTYDLKLAKDISIGKPGKNGEDGKIGIDGRDGHIGLNGSDGITVRGLDGKDGKPGEDGVTISGPKGEAGKDGIDGKVGISGKDGKDAVSISGKDGVGHIGLTGSAGTNGKDGASIDITVKNGYDKAGKDGKDGINGQKGVDGTSLTRIVYEDKTGEHQIATLEDGLKFKGDDGKEIAKKLNNTLDIIGGAKGDLTEGNIGVNSTTDRKLKIQLAKDLTGITSISNQKTEGGKTTGAKITLGTDGTTTITGGDINVGGNKVTNIKSALDGAKDANGNSATIATATGDALKNAANLGDLQNVYNDISAKADKASTSHTALTVEGNTSAGKGKDEKTKEDIYAGKNILLHESTDENGKVTYDLKLAKDISIGKPGKNGEDGKIGIDGRDGHIGLNGSDGITVRGLDGKDGKPGEDGVTISGPKGEAGKDGIDGKVGISGKDGKDAVSISGKDGVGHIGLTGSAGTNGKDGASIDITVKNGYDKAGKDGKDGINGQKGVDGTSLTRIVYEDKTGEHQIATLEDGLKFKGDDGKEIAKKLNNTLDIIGGAKGNLTEGNIGVNSDGDKLKVQLSKDLTGMNSTTYTTTTGEGESATTSTTVVNGNGLTITDGPSITNKGIDSGNKVITNVGSGIETDANGKYTVTDQNKGNAANIGDVQNMVNEAVNSAADTTNKALAGKANIDASNIGANLKNAEDQKTNAEKWGSAIGTGEIKADDGRMVTGKTVYDEVRPTEDGSYVKKDKSTGENLSALDSKIGKLDEMKKYNYIDSGKDVSISDNLTKLDTQVKNNADAIQKNSEYIQNITNNVKNLSDNAVQYDKDSNKTKVTLGGGEGGTTITNVKDGALSENSTDAVNGKQLYNEQKAREAADKAITEKVTNNTNEITKIKNGEGFTDTGKTIIKNLSKDAVQVKAGDRIKVDEATDKKTGNKTYTISANNNGTVAKGDGNLISGDTLYKEVHVGTDGTYVKSKDSAGHDMTVAQNLSALDTGLKTTSDLIHTNTKGDTIQIGGSSSASKIDVNGKDGKGRVITGVVSDANNPNSAANVGYVNGLTAANTQQIYRDMNNAYSRLDTNINRAAAGSNALAALHPLDFDPADKASFAVGYGHYRNANAAAVGAFYQPNANTMVNMGISLGNGDPGFNAGVSFKIGKGSAYNGVSKAEMAQTIHDQATEISAIKADDAAKDKRIDALEKENQEMKKQIQEILARLNG